MRGWLLIVATVGVLAASPAASARRHLAGWTHLRHSLVLPPPACPPGPSVTITVINQAGVGTRNLWRVEDAAAAQSLQVRAAWGSPCVQFGPGGSLLRLGSGIQRSDGATSYQLSGVHNPDGSIDVTTGGLPYTLWARAFTHEIVERLVDPTGTRYFGSYFAEVCDPVENLTYEVDQLQVSDFVTPAWFTGGPGPWDAARVLTSAS